jgi:hypothetical protein
MFVCVCVGPTVAGESSTSIMPSAAQAFCSSKGLSGVNWHWGSKSLCLVSRIDCSGRCVVLEGKGLDRPKVSPSVQYLILVSCNINCFVDFKTVFFSLK